MEGNNNGGHVEAEQIAAWLDGRLGESEREAVERHLIHCLRCRSIAIDAYATVAQAVAGALAALDTLGALIEHLRVTSQQQLADCGEATAQINFMRVALQHDPRRI